MEIVNRIIEDKFAFDIIVHNMKTNQSLGFNRYELIRCIDNSILGEWINKPVMYTSYNPCSMELVIYI